MPNETTNLTEAVVAASTLINAIPTTTTGTPKRTNLDVGDVGIVVEKVDGGMWNLLLDTEKHIAFSNKSRTEQTFVKAQWKDAATATKWSLIGKQLDPEAAERQLQKDVKAKVRKAVKGSATREDLQFLMRNGFSTEHGAIDVGLIESVHADMVADEAKKRNAKKMATNNGSLAAKLTTILAGESMPVA